MADVVIGHTTEDKTQLWLRGDRDRRQCDVTITADGGVGRALPAVTLDAHADYTKIVPVGDLRPDTTYYVRATFGPLRDAADGQYRPLPRDIANGRFRTLPQGSDAAGRIPFSFVLSSCNLSVVTISNLVANLLAKGGAAMAISSLDLPAARWAAPTDWLRPLVRPALRFGLGGIAKLIEKFTDLKQPGPTFIRSPFLKLAAVFDSTILLLTQDATMPAVGDIVTAAGARATVASSPRKVDRGFTIVVTHVEGVFAPATWLLTEDGSTTLARILAVSRGPQWYEDPSFFIHAGDQIYYDIPRENRRPELDAYRVAYKEAFFEDASLRQVLARWPHYMTLDDHEIADQFAHDFIAPEPPPDSKPDAMPPPTADDYLQTALQAYREYVHGRNPPTADGVYWYTFKVGACRFFVLDTRTRRFNDRRTEESRKTPTGRMIDATQMHELKRWLSEHPDDLKFVVSSVPFVAEINDTENEQSPRLKTRHADRNPENDKWSATRFRLQREELIEFIHCQRIQRLVFLTGDMHCCYHASMRIGGGLKYEAVTIHELAAGPVNQLQLPRVSEFHARRNGEIECCNAGEKYRLPYEVVLHQFHSQVNAVLHLRVRYDTVAREDAVLKADMSGAQAPVLEWNVIRTLMDNDASAWSTDTCTP